MSRSEIMYLTCSELVYFALRDPPDVVVGRVGGLLHEQQGDPLEQLVARHGCHGQVEEQAVQHRDGDVVEGTGVNKNDYQMMMFYHVYREYRHYLGIKWTEIPMRIFDTRLLTLVSRTLTMMSYT